VSRSNSLAAPDSSDDPDRKLGEIAIVRMDTPGTYSGGGETAEIPVWKNDAGLRSMASEFVTFAAFSLNRSNLPSKNSQFLFQSDQAEGVMREILRFLNSWR
jgi:hypothetical protein